MVYAENIFNIYFRFRCSARVAFSRYARLHIALHRCGEEAQQKTLSLLGFEKTAAGNNMSNAYDDDDMLDVIPNRWCCSFFFWFRSSLLYCGVYPLLHYTLGTLFNGTQTKCRSSRCTRVQEQDTHTQKEERKKIKEKGKRERVYRLIRSTRCACCAERMPQMLMKVKRRLWKEFERISLPQKPPIHINRALEIWIYIKYDKTSTNWPAQIDDARNMSRNLGMAAQSTKRVVPGTTYSTLHLAQVCIHMCIMCVVDHMHDCVTFTPHTTCIHARCYSPVVQQVLFWLFWTCTHLLHLHTSDPYKKETCLPAVCETECDRLIKPPTQDTLYSYG